jgi:hypothetical protein
MDGDKWVAHLSWILVDVAAGRAELPCICQPDDQSSNCLWSDHHVDDRQVGNDEVRPRTMRTGAKLPNRHRSGTRGFGSSTLLSLNSNC